VIYKTHCEFCFVGEFVSFVYTLRPILMVYTKNENKTGFVFVRVKIVMHGLTLTQEFCKLSNVRICSFVCLTFVDASMESLMMNFHKTLAASHVQVLTKAIAVVVCIFSSKSTSPL
jgi:hypothetical protein